MNFSYLKQEILKFLLQIIPIVKKLTPFWPLNHTNNKKFYANTRCLVLCLCLHIKCTSEDVFIIYVRNHKEI